MRESTPMSTAQVVRAFRRLPLKDQDCLQKAAEKLQAKTGMKLTDCLGVLAAIGVYAVRHGE